MTVGPQRFDVRREMSADFITRRKGVLGAYLAVLLVFGSYFAIATFLLSGHSLFGVHSPRNTSLLENLVTLDACSLVVAGFAAWGLLSVRVGIAEVIVGPAGLVVTSNHGARKLVQWNDPRFRVDLLRYSGYARWAAPNELDRMRVLRIARDWHLAGLFGGISIECAQSILAGAQSRGLRVRDRTYTAAGFGQRRLRITTTRIRSTFGAETRSSRPVNPVRG